MKTKDARDEQGCNAPWISEPRWMAWLKLVFSLLLLAGAFALADIGMPFMEDLKGGRK